MNAVAGAPLFDWLEGLTVGEVVIGLVALAAVAGWVRRKLWPSLRDVVLGLVDLVGAPARNGHEARPGLLATVARLVETVEAQGERIARVEGVAAEAASAAAAGQQGVQELGTKVAEISDKVDGLAAEQTQIRQAVEEIRDTGHAGTDAAGHDRNDPAAPSQPAAPTNDPED